MELRLVESVLRQVRRNVFDEFRDLFVLERVEQAIDLAGICRLIVPARDRPAFILAREHGLAFARGVDRDAIENIRIDSHQMAIAKIGRLRAENLFDLFRQRVDRSARGEAHVDLLLFFFGHAADLEHLPLFVVRREERDGSARFRQTVGAQIAVVFRHELLNLRVRYLRDQVGDLLIVAARLERLHDFPMIGFLFQLHFTGRGLQERAGDLRHGEVSQFLVAKLLGFFRDIVPDGLRGHDNLV